MTLESELPSSQIPKHLKVVIIILILIITTTFHPCPLFLKLSDVVVGINVSLGIALTSKAS